MENNTVIRSPRMLAVLFVATLLNLGALANASVPPSGLTASEPSALGEIEFDVGSLDARSIRFRFKEAVDVTTVDASTVVLHGPQGMVELQVTLAEGGLEALVTPMRQLQPGGSHTVFVKGVRTVSGRKLGMSTLNF